MLHKYEDIWKQRFSSCSGPDAVASQLRESHPEAATSSSDVEWCSVPMLMHRWAKEQVINSERKAFASKVSIFTARLLSTICCRTMSWLEYVTISWFCRNKETRVKSLLLLKGVVPD
jgi:hypothetical protein